MPTSSNLLNKSLRKTSLFVLTKKAVMESAMFAAYFKLLLWCCNQNPWKISFKKFSFRNEFLETFCKYINPGF